MAANSFALPSMKNCSSVSPSPSNFFLLQTNYHLKSEISTSILGEKLHKSSDFKSRPTRLRRRAVASLGGLLGSFFFKGDDTGEATRQKYGGTISLINNLEPEMIKLSDLELREKTAVLKNRASQGESLDSLLPEAFAVGRGENVFVKAFVLIINKIREREMVEQINLIHSFIGTSLYKEKSRTFSNRHAPFGMGARYKWVGLYMGTQTQNHIYNTPPFG